LEDGPDRVSDVLRLFGGFAVLDVIGVGEVEVGEQHLVDGGIRPYAGGRIREPTAVGQPLGHKPVKFAPALRTPEPSQIEISADQGTIA